MRKRTKAREHALKILYAIDITGHDPEQCIEVFWKDADESDKETRDFANAIVLGFCENRELIDKTITANATNWELKRMAFIDRNVLRAATYELFFCPDVPPKVAMNEAIDIAKKYDAVICLGTVIRGATPHFEFVASEAAKGVAKVSLDTGVPCIFGVITADNLEQAIERAGTKDGNKGRDAAISAIEMANLYEKI